jgi:hypothetical protein
MDVTERAEVKLARALDDVRLGYMRLWVTKRCEDEVREVDKLCVDLEDARRRHELRFYSVRGRTIHNECARERHDERAPVEHRWEDM